MSGESGVRQVRGSDAEMGCALKAGADEGRLVFTWAKGPDDVGKVVEIRAALAELLGTALFVTVGCGTACAYGGGDSGRIVLISFAFGMTALALVYSLGHLSGGQMNCAVTFSLWLGGALPVEQGVANFLMQTLGSFLGALWVAFMFPCHADMTQGLATNSYDRTYGVRDGLRRAFAGEVVCTFLLCLVVWETAVSPRSRASIAAPIAIGFAVFVAHVLLIPVDGCSINPTRSFGPAVVAVIMNCEEYPEPVRGLEDMWVMVLGPLLGAALAVVAKTAFACGPRRETGTSTGEGSCE